MFGILSVYGLSARRPARFTGQVCRGLLYGAGIIRVNLGHTFLKTQDLLLCDIDNQLRLEVLYSPLTEGKCNYRSAVLRGTFNAAVVLLPIRILRRFTWPYRLRVLRQVTTSQRLVSIQRRLSF